MQTKATDPKLLRKRRFFLLLPLLILPFTTLLFWALGGGKNSEAGAVEPSAGGMNTQLPDATLKEDPSLTKLSYYEKAASDSAKLEEQLKADPFYRGQKPALAERTFTGDTSFPTFGSQQIFGSRRNSLNLTTDNSAGNGDPNEARVYQKLDELKAVLNEASVRPTQRTDQTAGNRAAGTPVNSADIDRLENMIHMTKAGDSGEDPEMDQLNAVMDKILAIQHPERVKEKVKKPSGTSERQVYPVTTGEATDNISLLSNERDASPNSTDRGSGFFSLSDDIDKAPEQQNATAAVVDQLQAVVDGAVVKLRLVSDMTINDVVIPKGSFVFGTAALNGERLKVNINSVRHKSLLLRAHLAVFDMDGLEGIYIPGAITGDVVKNSAERAVQGIGLTSLNPSIGTQAASAGIEAAKTLFSKKAKLVKVTLNAGYQVLLRNEQQGPASLEN